MSFVQNSRSDRIREEIQAMLKVDDTSAQTRVYREAQEEGRQEGRQERQRQLQRDRDAIRRLASKNFAAEEIAEALQLDMEFVRGALANDGA